MRNLNNIIILAFSALTLVSCSKKKDTPTVTNPTVNDTTTQADASKLATGDWHGVSAYNLYYDASGNMTGADGGSKYYSHSGMYWADSMEEKFTFHADGTYDHVRVDGQTGWDFFSIFIPVHGTWQLKNDNRTFAITYVGGVSGNGQQDFKVQAFTDHYLHVTYTDSSHPRKDVYHMEFSH